MRGYFDTPGLGKCLVGTYTIRKLTKHFNCTANELGLLPSKPGVGVEVISYLVKFSYENAQIQEKGIGGMIEKPLEEIENVIDSIEDDSEFYPSMFEALSLSLWGKTLEEVKGEQTPEQTEEAKKKNTTTTNTGKKSTK